MERLFLVTYSSYSHKVKRDALPPNIEVIFEESESSRKSTDAIVQILTAQSTRPDTEAPLPQHVMERAALVCEIRRGRVDVFKSRPTVEIEEANEFLNIFSLSRTQASGRGSG